MEQIHKFSYRWTLKDAKFTKDKGKVFSCFACGGGSTMGYKLAGFDVIGCNEIDPRMNKCYVENHHPKYNFLCDIREMVKAVEFPTELYNLDVLDGSPPCSTFSISGSREETWGKKKKFKEGQKEQVLDTLFFDFIALAKKLQPKVVIAENVRGLLVGNAIDYVRRIYDGFEDAGYYCQHFLLDGSKMGVPQRRERVFFICLRKDLSEKFLIQEGLFDVKPYINMTFQEKPIHFGEFADYKGKEITAKECIKWWSLRNEYDDGLGDVTKRLTGKEIFFNSRFDKDNEVAHTLTARDQVILYNKCKRHSEKEVKCISTFPMDYNFMDNRPEYICGMSVPPVMMAQVASRVYDCWLKYLN